MWIDINAKLGQWPFKKLLFDDAPTLVQRMDKFGVDLSVVSSLNSVFYKNTQSGNQCLFDEWQSSSILKNRLLPFCVINPTYPGWQYDFRKCIEDWGMYGVCVYPQYHDYDIAHPALIELAVLAQEYDVPIVFTLRMTDFRQRSWMDVTEEWALADVLPLLKRVPETKYIILNLANSTRLAPEDEAFFNRCNILMDTSGRMLNRLSDHIKRWGIEKFAFGSHTPILDYCTSRLRIEYLDNEYDHSMKDQIRYRNATKFLKLSQ